MSLRDWVVNAKNPGKALPVDGIADSGFVATQSSSEPPEEQQDIADHWLILRPPEKLERWFSPPISRNELAALYPGAALIPIQAVASGPPTDQHKAELTILVGLAAAASGFTEGEHAEALDKALRDPEGALASFSALARELGVLEERSRGNDSVRLWITIESEEAAQRVAVDIPKGKFDGVALLEMFEKHKKARTTKVIGIDTELTP